ncbi:hypothetical protein EON63_14885 [archaeon]|nr:MAG: hypothetical protein EON63_14885 [archaeon]
MQYERLEPYLKMKVGYEQIFVGRGQGMIMHLFWHRYTCNFTHVHITSFTHLHIHSHLNINIYSPYTIHI